MLFFLLAEPKGNTSKGQGCRGRSRGTRERFVGEGRGVDGRALIPGFLLTSSGCSRALTHHDIAAPQLREPRDRLRVAIGFYQFLVVSSYRVAVVALDWKAPRHRPSGTLRGRVAPDPTLRAGFQTTSPFQGSADDLELGQTAWPSYRVCLTGARRGIRV